jgi:hypothetical protein
MSAGNGENTMSALSVRLPKSLHERVRELAAREGISINQLIASALAEKMSAIMTAEYLEAHAQRGTRQKFLSAIAQVPDVAPEPYDRMSLEEPSKPRQHKRAAPNSIKVARHSRNDSRR